MKISEITGNNDDQITLCIAVKNVSVDKLWKNRNQLVEQRNKDYVLEPRKSEYLLVYMNKLTKHLMGKKKSLELFLKYHHPFTYQKKIRSFDILFSSIKKNGLKAPLEFYRQNNNIILYRGYRRLTILKYLGYEKTTIRLHKNVTTLKKLHNRYKWNRGSINELGAKQFVKYRWKATDKYYVNNYLNKYDALFSLLRKRKINILEIGALRGASLVLWQKAFPYAQIYGIDKDRNRWKEFVKDNKKIKVFIGLQQDKKFLKQYITNRKYTIIIDDGGHNPKHQWESFCELWPVLNEGGFYVIEDCYRSFLPENKDNINIPITIANWINFIYNKHEIKSLHFYYNLCIIQKGINYGEQTKLF